MAGRIGRGLSGTRTNHAMVVAQVISRPGNGMPSRLVVAITDLLTGLKQWELWSTLGWHDIRQRYRRSMVGPFWLTLSMGVMVAGLAYLYGGVFGTNSSNASYLSYVAIGMIVFTLISSLATDGALVFISSSAMILQLRAPLSLYLYQMIWRNLLIFAHNITIYVLVVVFGHVQLSWNVFLALPGLFFVVLTGVWCGLALGSMSARFRDVPPIVGSVMQIAFFLTPIFWMPEAIPGRGWLVHLNPLYYLVEVVRAPLIGKTPGWEVWLAVIGINVLGAVVSLLFFARYRQRIAYWV